MLGFRACDQPIKVTQVEPILKIRCCSNLHSVNALAVTSVTLSANCPIILIGVTVYCSNQQFCGLLKSHSFHCFDSFNCINRNFRNYFLALKQIKCWWYNKIHDCKNFFGSFMFAFQIKSKNAHMIKIIVCTTMKQFNRANRFKRFFVNNCSSDKPFG